MSVEVFGGLAGGLILLAFCAFWLAWLVKTMRYRLHVRYEGDEQRETEFQAAYWRTVQRCREAGIPEKVLRKAWNRVVVRESSRMPRGTNGECVKRSIRIRPNERWLRYAISELLIRRLAPIFDETKDLRVYGSEGSADHWFKSRGIFPAKP